jgi:Protein of unknown function (DUF2975)
MLPTAHLSSKDRLVKGSRLFVRLAIIANRVFFFGVIALLTATVILSTRFVPLLIPQTPTPDLASALTGLRLLMLIGLAMAVATEILLRALAQIIASTGAGDPFIAANARRLQTIGWALLGLQLLAIPCALLDKFCPALGSAAPGASFSPGGWLAVLMVFVLSRVFAAGSTMRDELEGTV